LAHDPAPEGFATEVWELSGAVATDARDGSPFDVGALQGTNLLVLIRHRF
jgi:hypothetical protein